jgi:broad specificity phosphatase PhoE
MSTAMVRLLLIRHGVTEWNDAGRLMGRMPIPLSPHGRAGIERLAAALASEPLKAIYSSPQRRTQETAAIIAASHSLAVQTEEGLDEVWLSPQWQGRTFAELRDQPELAALRADPTYVCDFIESIVKVQQRVVETVERLCASRSSGVIAIVSHGDPLRVLVAHALSMPLAHFRTLLVNTGSLSVVDRHGDRSQLVLLSWKPADTLATALSATTA